MDINPKRLMCTSFDQLNDWVITNNDYIRETDVKIRLKAEQHISFNPSKNY